MNSMTLLFWSSPWNIAFYFVAGCLNEGYFVSIKKGVFNHVVAQISFNNDTGKSFQIVFRFCVGNASEILSVNGVI